MQKLRNLTLAVALGATMASCTDDFASINLDPGLINEPNPAFLFTDALTAHGTGYTQWFYDYYNYFYRWNQATVFSGGNEVQFNDIGATDGGSSPYGLRGNLDEIRRQIGMMNEEQQATRQQMVGITYIPPIYHGIQRTDRWGSAPWSEAMQGRYESNFSPKYDTQRELFEQWLDELNLAIDLIRGAQGTQLSYGVQDFVYGGDASKWARLANSTKLRIAARVAGQDAAWAQSIIAEAVANPAGFITDAEHDFLYSPGPEYRGSAQDFWGSPTAAKNFVSSMREARDPRVHFFFTPNAFSQETVDLFVAQGRDLPDWIDPNVAVDPFDRYRGGPVAPDVQGQRPYFGGSYQDADGLSYLQLSHINRRFFAPQYQGGQGYLIEPRLTSADVAFYLAEFIEKGWVSGPIEGRGVAEWYEHGVRHSMRIYDEIANRAGVFDYDQFAVTTAQVDEYLTRPEVDLNSGVGSVLEKIHYQQFINYFKNGTEQWTLVRRTGFPSRTGQILQWDAPMAGGQELPIPRRFPVNEPDNPINIDNWRSAMQTQGFTWGTSLGQDLNVERVWFDQSNPNYGNGSF